MVEAAESNRAIARNFNRAVEKFQPTGSVAKGFFNRSAAAVAFKLKVSTTSTALHVTVFGRLPKTAERGDESPRFYE